MKFWSYVCIIPALFFLFFRELYYIGIKIKSVIVLNFICKVLQTYDFLKILINEKGTVKVNFLPKQKNNDQIVFFRMLSTLLVWS